MTSHSAPTLPNQLAPSSDLRVLIPYHFEFAKSYIYCVYSGDLSTPNLEVIRITGKSDGFLHRPKLISVSIEKDTGFVRVIDNYLTATLRFNERLYDISFYIEERHDIILYNLFVLGLEPAAQQSSDLADLIRSESMSYSPFRNATIETTADRDGQFTFPGEIFIRAATIGKDTLDQIFLPEKIRYNIELFVHALLEFERARTPLRYLLAGKPGTAKTKIIQAIADSCAGKATFIFTNGNETRIESLFDFAAMFSPVVLCIDDIDLMTGSRKEGLYTPRLASFLQKLDGFVHRDFFMLATTNNKELVDIAASRPGRFDMILDVGSIQPRQYEELIASKTENQFIRNLFDSDILSVLGVKKVSGAFIANIVKHLELVMSYEPEKVCKEYLLQLVRDSHQGFYETLESNAGRPGFQVA